MKLHHLILSAAAVLMGLAACSKSDEGIVAEQETQENLVPVTLGANFSATKTTMAENGDILWSANDVLKVIVGQNNYDFTLDSGSGTTSATFSALVTEGDAAIIAGTAAGTVTAYYPTSALAVPATQEYADGTFTDGTLPMTATYTSPVTNPSLTFTTKAAVVRVQGVSASATKAVLSYTVSETPYSVTMNLEDGETAKDLYFVVVPGAQKFNLSLNGSDSAVEYSASAVTVAGSRYDLTASVAQIGDLKYATLAEAVTAATAAGKQTTIKMIANYNVGEFTGNKIVISSSADIILDLNGKTISGTGNGGVASYLFWNSGTLKIVDTVGDGTITYSSTTPDGSYGYGTSTLLNRGILEVASGHIVNTTSGGASYAVDNQTLWWDEMTTVTFTLSGTANLECTTGDAGLRQSIGCGTEYKKEGQDIINNVNIIGGTITGDIWIQRCNIDPFGNLSITAGTITGKVYDANSLGSATNVTYAVSGGTIGSISLAKTHFITGGTFSTKPADTYIASGYAAKAQGTTPETWKVVSSQKEVTPETVQEALDNAEDGTIIILGAGDYPTLYLRNNCTEANRIFKDITIKAATGAAVTVEQIVYDRTDNVKTLDIENLTIDGITFDVPEKSAVLFDVNGAKLRVNGLTIQNCSKTGNKSQGTTYDNAAFVGLYYDGDTAIDTKFAGDETLTCGYHNIVVQNNTITSVFQPIKVPNVGPLYGMTITGNIFDDCQDNHMMLSSLTAGTVTITDNTIKNMTGRFARISGAQADANFVISGNTVTTPKTYDTGGDGSIVKISGNAGFSVSDSNNQWEAGAFTTAANTTWIANGTADKLPIAQNGNSYYYSDNALASAVSAAKSGSVKTVTILKTGDYTLPGDVSGLTIEAKTGVTPTFTIVSKGSGYSIAGANGSTLKGLKFILPCDNYIGFWEASVTFDSCTFENLLTTYSAGNKQVFNSCSFKSSGNKYSVWAYGPCDFNNCTFTTDEGKAIYLYTESPNAGYAVNFANCEFTNTNTSSYCRKPAILIKTRVGSNLYTNGYKVTITSCTASGFASFSSKNDDVYDYADDGLWGIETVSGDDLTYTATYLTVNGTQVYPGFYPDADDANLHHVINAKGLKMFRDAVNGGNTYVGKTIKLEGDIDLNNVENWDPIGLVGTPFNGTFDGQNHTISNLKINRNNHAGLFGYCINHGYIKNVTVDKAIITTNHYAGAILAQGYADIINCHVKNSSITCAPEEVSTGNWDNGDKAGAMAGQIQEGGYKIHNCSATYCTVKGYRDVGGLVGYKYAGADYKNNTVTGKSGEVTVTVDNTHNYEGYTTNAQYHANAIVGECNGELDASNTFKDVSFSYPNNEN